MGICKGVTKDVQKQAEIQNLKLSGRMSELVGTKTEEFIASLLQQSAEVCTADKRKIVSTEDVKAAVHKKGLKILYPLFD